MEAGRVCKFQCSKFKVTRYSLRSRADDYESFSHLCTLKGKGPCLSLLDI